MSTPGDSNVPADGTGGDQFMVMSQRSTNTPLLGVIKLDPWLSPFKDALKSRFNHAQKWIKTINDTEGGFEKFSKVLFLQR